MYRVRILYRDGSVSVLDQAFSQLCETLGDWKAATREESNQFWRGEIAIDTGRFNVKLVNR